MEILTLESIEMERRKKVSISLAPSVIKELKRIIKEEGLITETGKPYTLSWLIEDMILYIIGNPEVYRDFIEKTYEEACEP